ncbi:MAG: alpha-2-macroglobulin family protein [Hydrogenophilaceae bacterium]|nr:alpha-2-macroglobulin family protein [Hydrogenophilaceae bacterium]
MDKFKQFVTANANWIIACGLFLLVGVWGGAVGSMALTGGARGPAPLSAMALQGPDPIRAADEPRAPADRPAGMAFMNVRIDTSTATPRACLEFTKPIAAGGDINLRDYLVIEPEAQVQVEASDTLMCLSGLPFEPDRQVTIRRGLLSTSGERTARDETFTLSFGDRPAYVGFVGDGVILPRSEADGLAIETVNVSTIKIQVLRVNDRILSQRGLNVGEIIEEGGYGYWSLEYEASDVGVKVYEGEIDVARARERRNQAVTTVFPLGAVLEDRRPGAYVVRLIDGTPGAGQTGGDTDRPAGAYRWIMYTDMALQTFTGADGLDVVVRGLSSADTMSGVTLTLIAQNNDELARAQTDSNGHVRFGRALTEGEGPARPRYVMAYSRDGDFAALDLDTGALDLSERGIDGRTPPGDIDAFLYTERGIYRPGETVRLMGLIRDIAGRAISDRPSTLVVYRPNGTEARRLRLNAAERAGGVARNIAMDRGAPRGVWRAELIVDGQEQAAGQTSWSIEDFVPQRLRVQITADETPIIGSQRRAIDVQADFLYGAPGSGLQVTAEGRLQIDPNPFPSFRQYTFGVEDESFEERFFQLPETTTDGDGHAQIIAGIDDPPQTTLPLRARLVASVQDPGGRVVRESFSAPVRLSNRYLGVRQRFDNRAVRHNGTANFDVIAVNANGARVAARGVSWTLVREDWSYDWYLDNGRWRWRRTGRDVPIAGGTTDIAANAPVRISRGGLDHGSYRLIVRDGQGAETSSRFYAGWGGGEDSDTPDMVTVAGPSEPVRAGRRADIQIRAPYAGEAQVVVATDRVLSMRTVSVAAEGATISLPVEESWGGGAYVLVTVMTPRDPANLPVPRRAIGVTYVPVDTGSRTMEVAVGEGLGVVRPRQTINVPIAIENMPRGETVNVMLAAVDEGILQLTKYESPNPSEHFFGRRALGVLVRDDYGRLLNPNLGAPSRPRQGGDSLGGEGLTVVPTKTVSLFTNAYEVGRNGRVTVPLDVPDFNGRLRIMAVAWSNSAVGEGEHALVVRDPVVAELVLPRFLAPGDEALATLTVDNVEGAAGTYQTAFAATGAARTTAQAERMRLQRRQRGTARVAITAPAAGLGQVQLTLTGPAGFERVVREYSIQARAPYLPITETQIEEQAPNVSYRPPTDVLARFAPREGSLVVSYSALAGLDPAPLLAQLERYPYGCTEQLVSTSMPLLYFNAVAQAVGRAQDQRLRRRVQDAITRILDRQGADGAIGLWRANDASSTPWVGAYAVDFLVRAKAQGYIVPDAALELAYAALRRVARLNDFAGVAYDFEVYRWPGSNDTEELLRSRSAAYALYVLAKAGQADIGQLRYFHDTPLRNEPSPLARAQIGAALAHLGDRARARNAFRLAEQAIGYENTGDWYQTPLRDLTGVIALAAEAGETATVSRLRARLTRMEREPEAMMTQEQAQTLLAVNALSRAAGPVNVSLNGAAGAGRRVTADAAQLARGLVFRNDGRGAVWRTLTLQGPPREAPPAVSAGYSLDKTVYTLDGRVANLGELRQGDRVIVSISGQPAGVRMFPTVLVDLLPAGLEIESVLGPQDGVQPDYYGGGQRNGPFAFLGVISYARIAEARDDRFVAAADIRNTSFRFAYVARAVTAGSFTMPPAQVEDMYRPGVYARTSVGRIAIAPPGG